MPRVESSSSNQRDSRKHDPTDKKSRTCEVCGRELSRKSDISRHMKLHLAPEEKEKLSYRCIVQDCPFKSLQKSNADAHIASHTGNRDLFKKCPDCDFASADPGSLSRHRRRKHQYAPARRWHPEQKVWTPQQIAQSTRPRPSKYIDQDQLYSPDAITQPLDSIRTPSPVDTNQIVVRDPAHTGPPHLPPAENPLISRNITSIDPSRILVEPPRSSNFPPVFDYCLSPTSSVEEFPSDGVGMLTTYKPPAFKLWSNDTANSSMRPPSGGTYDVSRSSLFSRDPVPTLPYPIRATSGDHSERPAGKSLFLESNKPYLPPIQSLFAVSEKGANKGASTNLLSFRL
ncbi:hypothetical protein VKT23_010383 [Stygiomarasmius scandens]|uniref:C2H2-type domain-containing protein n=1 Tax=Marasmiellus scandens TaxID=2682957 RepID=A0ABR1JCE1_9AGAR